MIEVLQYAFMRNALAAAVLASVACGVVGAYVVVKRIVFISGGVSHAAFGGIGLGYLLGANPILTAIPFSVLAALTIGVMSKRGGVGEDAAIGIVWTLGMALGIIFVALSPGYAPDLFSYLFGSILMVSPSDLAVMLILDGVIALTVALFQKEFLAISFDEEFSEVVGVPTEGLYFLLLCLVALSIVVLIRIVGVILVMALLTIPATVSKQFVHNIKEMILLSTFLGAVLTVLGLWLSYILDLPSGATIVLVLAAGFILSLLAKNLLAGRSGESSAAG